MHGGLGWGSGTNGPVQKLVESTAGLRMLANSGTRWDPQAALCAIAAMNFLFLVLLLKTRNTTGTQETQTTKGSSL